MPRKIGALHIAVGVSLLSSASLGYAADKPVHHPTPWPIWHWHNHQPTRAQLHALHEHDVTPAEAREIDRLYDQLMQRPQNSPR